MDYRPGYHLTADEVEALGTDTVVLPIGSTEQHGPHLPVSTDVLIGGILSRRIAKELGAFVTPVIPISTCREMMGKKGSVFMKPETCYQMLFDICESLVEQGYKKIVLFQSHGGIFVIPPFVRQFNATHNPDVCLCKVEIMNLMGDARAEGLLDTEVCMHADEYETSVLLAEYPELVHMDRAVDCTPDVPREFLNYGSIFRFSPSGVWGCPTAATAEKGKALIDSGVRSAVKYIKEVFSLMEQKGTFGYSDF